MCKHLSWNRKQRYTSAVTAFGPGTFPFIQSYTELSPGAIHLEQLPLATPEQRAHLVPTTCQGGCTLAHGPGAFPALISQTAACFQDGMRAGVRHGCVSFYHKNIWRSPKWTI